MTLAEGVPPGWVEALGRELTARIKFSTCLTAQPLGVLATVLPHLPHWGPNLSLYSPFEEACSLENLNTLNFHTRTAKFRRLCVLQPKANTCGETYLPYSTLMEPDEQVF